MTQEGQELGFVFRGDGGENVGDAGNPGEFVFARRLGFEGGEVEGGGGVIGCDEGLDNVGDGQGVCGGGGGE